MDWAFAERFDLMAIEVRPDDPYSVKVHYYVSDGRLYLEGGENGWSRWRGFLHDDPDVRVRFGERVYAARAVRVTASREIARVLPLFYAKDRDKPSPACERAWTAADCGFAGEFFRIESSASEN